MYAYPHAIFLLYFSQVALALSVQRFPLAEVAILGILLEIAALAATTVTFSMMRAEMFMWIHQLLLRLLETGPLLVLKRTVN